VRRVIPVLILATLCACTPQPHRAEDHSHAALTSDQLAQATYPIEFAPGGRATLHDGTFRSADSTVSVSLLKSTLGDLDGDGIGDAAVVLRSDPGGSGRFFTLVEMKNRNGIPLAIAHAELGDRIRLDSLAIESGAIRVRLLTQGPADGLCCPTQLERRIYHTSGDTLIGIATVVGRDTSFIAGQ